MADNRKIRNKIRGLGGKHFAFGMEDELAAAYDQNRLDELKRDGAIEGDWTSTKSPMTITGDNVSDAMAGKLNTSGGGASVAESSKSDFQPLSIEETLQAIKRLDFSEQVTRSMTFHGEALKEAMSAKFGPSSRESNPKENEPKGENKSDVAPGENNPPADDGFPTGFPAYGKAALKKLGKTAKDVSGLSREDLIALDGIAEKSADEIVEFFAKSNDEKGGDK